MNEVNVLAIQRIGKADAEAIRAVDGRIRLVDAGGWYDGEIRASWPAFTSARYLQPGSEGQGTQAERDRLLAEAHIVLAGFPFPLDIRARAPKLKWLHQRPAGASNLIRGDIWKSDVLVTTSRGLGNVLNIAEYALAGVMHFAKAFALAGQDRAAGAFSFGAYRPLTLAGKTACVVGAGGIGQEVGRLFAGVGMRVVGTRRSPAAPTEGFVEIGGPGDLDRYLAEADVVAICCQWTPETTHLFDTARFGGMKPGAILVNVARGEIIDEAALAEAVQGDRLRGVVLDVYDGEFEGPPRDDLWSDPRVLITPHTSGGGDMNAHRGTEIFCENLRAYLDGQPLKNVVDWDRGY